MDKNDEKQANNARRTGCELLGHFLSEIRFVLRSKTFHTNDSLTQKQGNVRDNSDVTKKSLSSIPSVNVRGHFENVFVKPSALFVLLNVFVKPSALFVLLNVFVKPSALFVLLNVFVKPSALFVLLNVFVKPSALFVLLNVFVKPSALFVLLSVLVLFMAQN